MGRSSQKRDQAGEARLEAEREAAAEARRQRLRGGITAGVLVIAIIVAVVLGATAGDDATSASTEGAFGTHFTGLEERRVEAGVPTMAEGGGEHFHPVLEVYPRGKPMPIPANIGIDPAQPPTMMAGLHTHDTSGTIHNEAGTGSTLGQFFAIWGIPFSATRLGPYEAGGNERVRMWVDGEPSSAYGDLELADGQRIVVAYGTEDQIPDGLAP